MKRNRIGALGPSGLLVVLGLGLGLVFGLVAAGPAGAAPGTFITTVPVITSGLADPISVTNAGDGTGRLFIIEQQGRIRIWTGSSLLTTPFLNIVSLTGCPTSCGERGL